MKQIRERLCLLYGVSALTVSLPVQYWAFTEQPYFPNREEPLFYLFAWHLGMLYFLPLDSDEPSVLRLTRTRVKVARVSLLLSGLWAAATFRMQSPRVNECQLRSYAHVVLTGGWPVRC